MNPQTDNIGHKSLAFKMAIHLFLQLLIRQKCFMWSELILSYDISFTKVRFYVFIKVFKRLIWSASFYSAFFFWIRHPQWSDEKNKNVCLKHLVWGLLPLSSQHVDGIQERSWQRFYVLRRKQKVFQNLCPLLRQE